MSSTVRENSVDSHWKREYSHKNQRKLRFSETKHTDILDYMLVLLRKELQWFTWINPWNIYPNFLDAIRNIDTAYVYN